MQPFLPNEPLFRGACLGGELLPPDEPPEAVFEELSFGRAMDVGLAAALEEVFN